MRIVVFGLSITSSWGNGHATTYRSLLKGLNKRGHDVLFLERDQPWYRENRDVPGVPYARVEFYQSVRDLELGYGEAVGTADLVIVGSYVPDGVAVGDWVLRTASGITAFYDVDTPVTLAKLMRGDQEYLTASAIPKYGMYLSFTGGPTLRRIERDFGARMARALYCSVDPELYYPEHRPAEWLLGYLGTYSADRQPALEALLIEPAKTLGESKFAVAGPLYPDEIEWPVNVERCDHLPPQQHRAFYNGQQFTLNITRADMVMAGYSPSVRLFEAAACGTPIVSDAWVGLDELFTPGKEILVAGSTAEALRVLTGMNESERNQLGANARSRVLSEHTAVHRAAQVEQYVAEYRALSSKVRPGRVEVAAVRRRRQDA